MDIQRCLEILELDETASIADVTQAYKDIVNVWHPDRFTHNPRLQRKAEGKIKEINTAYETLKNYYARKRVKEEELNSPRMTAEKRTKGSSGVSEKRDSTEVAFELGTQFVLSTWSYLTSKFRRMVETQVINREEEQQGRGKGKNRDLT